MDNAVDKDLIIKTLKERNKALIIMLMNAHNEIIGIKINNYAELDKKDTYIKSLEIEIERLKNG